MTSIYDVPYEDIQEFLLANNKSYTNEIDAYNKALVLLKNKKAIGHPISIIEWIIARNLMVKKVNIPNFTIYQIDKMKQFEIDELARLLTMNGNDRDNVKNILKYLGKLDILIEHLDIKPQILDTILELKVLSSNLEEVITIFKNNKFLRKFIYDNMGKIISNNIVNKSPGKITKEVARKVSKFIFDLMKLNENILFKQAIKISSKYEINDEDEDHPLPKIIKYLSYNVLTSLDTDLIIKYFDLFDYINSIYEGKVWLKVIDDYTIKSALIDPENELEHNQVKFLPFIFKAALMREKMEVLQPIYHFWWFEDGYYEKGDKSNENFMKQMKPLIKEFSEKYPTALYTL